MVEDYVSLGEGVTFSNAATELVAGDNAHVSHYMIVPGDQAYNFSTLRSPAGPPRKCSITFVSAGWRVGAQQRASRPGGRGKRVPD